VFGLRLAAAVPFGRSSGDTTTATGLGLFWLYDARDFMAEIWGDFFTSSAERASMFDIGIGGYYPFSKNNVTPYVGAAAAGRPRTSAARAPAGCGCTRLRHADGPAVVGAGARRGGYFFNLYGEKTESSPRSRALPSPPRRTTGTAHADPGPGHLT
jgi:hypothetical protein